MTILRRVLLAAVIVTGAVLMFFYANNKGQSKSTFVFQEHLSDVAAWVDGEEITLSDLIFYVLYQEQKIETHAAAYNPDNTKDYWNAHVNGRFVAEQVKESVIGMAIHDRIMYTLASENNTVLTSDDKKRLEDARTTFWDNLYPGQLERLPFSFEEGNAKMKEIALMESYVIDLAKKEPEMTVAGLGWDGYDYEQIEKEHDVRINEKVWDRVRIGDISLLHERTSYINGMTDEELEEFRKNKGK